MPIGCVCSLTLRARQQRGTNFPIQLTITQIDLDLFRANLLLRNAHPQMMQGLKNLQVWSSLLFTQPETILDIEWRGIRPAGNCYSLFLSCRRRLWIRIQRKAYRNLSSLRQDVGLRLTRTQPETAIGAVVALPVLLCGLFSGCLLSTLRLSCALGISMRSYR